MLYSCRLEPNGNGGYIARFDDVPEALTEGASREEAVSNAAEALEVALLGRMKDGGELPLPSAPAKARTIQVTVPIQSAAKLEFYKAFRESGISRVALAAKLGKDESEVRRYLDPYHATKLPALDEALRALGRRFVVGVEAA